MARVDLTTVDLNPEWRMNGLDPLDKPHVADLTASILRAAGASGRLEDGVHGKTGGIVLRHGPDDTIECVTRRHLISAAIAAARKLDVEPVLELPVRKLSENEAAIICATENSTQRAGVSGAQMAIAAMATRQILAAVLGEGVNVPEVQGTFTPRAIETIRGQVASPKGLGADAVWEYLQENVPGVTRPVVDSFFAAIKASGDYDKIVADVMKSIGAKGKTPAELEAERAEAELEQARKEREASPSGRGRAKEKVDVAKARAKRVSKAVENDKPRAVTFDAGVAAILPDIPCLNAFRKIVTNEPIKSMLAVKDQVGLAKQIVADAKSQGRDGVTALFIRERIGVLVQNIRTDVSRAKREEFKTADASRVLKEHAHQFSKTLGFLTRNALKLVEHLEKHKGTPLEMPSTLSRDVEIGKRIFDRLHALMDGEATPASVVKLIAHQKG